MTVVAAAELKLRRLPLMKPGHFMKFRWLLTIICYMREGWQLTDGLINNEAAAGVIDVRLATCGSNVLWNINIFFYKIIY